MFFSTSPWHAPPRMHTRSRMADPGAAAASLIQAGAAALAVKQSSRKPPVDRTHESVDLDNDRASVAAASPRTRQTLSREQKRRIKIVFFMHRHELDQWYRKRRVVSFLVKGHTRARWEPAWPGVPWEKVAYDPSFGIFADSVMRIKTYYAKLGRSIRKLQASGQLTGLPAWAARKPSGWTCLPPPESWPEVTEAEAPS